MKLIDMAQCGWETWAFHKVAGGQAKYHRIVQRHWNFMWRQPNQDLSLILGNLPSVCFNPRKWWTPCHCFQPWDGEPDMCIISPSETGEEEIRNKIIGSSGNWDSVMGLKSLQRRRIFRERKHSPQFLTIIKYTKNFLFREAKITTWIY